MAAYLGLHAFNPRRQVWHISYHNLLHERPPLVVWVCSSTITRISALVVYQVGLNPSVADGTRPLDLKLLHVLVAPPTGFGVSNVLWMDLPLHGTVSAQSAKPGLISELPAVGVVQPVSDLDSLHVVSIDGSVEQDGRVVVRGNVSRKCD